LTTNLLAQESKILWYNQVGRNEGLSSQEHNLYSFTDAEGYTWISSEAGLNRFDGYQTKQYRSDFQDSTAMYGENIQSRFFEDQRHNLWFSTYQSIHCYIRATDSFRHFFVRPKGGQRLEDSYYVFCLEQDSILWFRAGKDIYRANVSGTNFSQAHFDTLRPVFSSKYFHFSTGLDSEGAVSHIFGFSYDKRAGTECCRIEHGVLRDQNSFFEQPDQGTEALSVFQVFFENETKVWMTTDKGIICLNLVQPNQIQRYPVKFPGYTHLAVLDNDHFVVSFGKKGLFLFDKTTGQFSPFTLMSVRQDQTHKELDCRNLYIDRNKVLWVFVPLRGVLYVNLLKRKFDAISDIPVSKGVKVKFRNFIQDHSGRIFCAYDAGILVFSPTGKLTDHIKIGMGAVKSLSINCIQEDGEGGLLVATNKGLWHSTSVKRRFNVIPGTANTVFLYMYRLSNGTLLASTLNRGVLAVKRIRGNWKLSPLIDSEAGYTSIFEDAQQNIYICSNETSINRFVLKADTLLLIDSLPFKGAVNAYWEDTKEKTLWIGTSFGLAKVQLNEAGNRFIFFTEKNGLPDQHVQSIVSDGKKLWLSTKGGLCSYLESTGFRRYSIADGAVSATFYEFAGIRLQNGELWFGGENGITKIPPIPVPDINTKAIVLINEIRINDTIPKFLYDQKTGAVGFNQMQHITLKFKDNSLAFSFVAADFAFPEGTQLRYKLEGADKNWVLVSDGKPVVARYSNLEENDYVLQVQAANSDGHWNDELRQLHIKILPPYWRTWQFRMALGLLIIGLITGGFLYRINQIRRTEQLKRRISENKMAALIAQMNPHFVFNSLQSIDNYILKKNRKQASEYLGRFSRLIRLILENSRHTVHSLEKERELLDLYLKVEAQRFNKPFEYELIIDDTLDTYEVQVPTMMLQPFVENAIWHGLFHSSKPGRIEISLQLVDGLLKCSVTDNGIGRKLASEIAIKNGRSHESLALQIILERLKILFPKQQHLCTIRYADHYDYEGQGAGTTVEICLPAQL
jgi:ligand-binding sensor domain-containing protein